jgi:phosphoribosyl 1,2-cyclic phosphodiesterase
MALYIASLNSGSNGNCYYVGNSNEAILVDVGIPCREVERRMIRSGLSMSKVKAIFISHEHFDHIRGVEVLAKRYKLPVYITDATLQNTRIILDRAYVKSFKAYQPVTIGELSILAFPKRHDAVDPHSFTVEYKGIKVGVLTDIGSSCEHVIANFKDCHAAFLESNYDEEMLDKGNYPYHLKRRIKSDLGHLSNMQALELFTSHKQDFMSHLFLSHLSKDNNSPELAKSLFEKHSGNTRIFVASRYEESPVYKINEHSFESVSEESEAKQMSLF